MEARKRGRSDGFLNGNGGFKKNKQEMENFSTGIGTKSKPCTKFFSTTGCQFGEGCHFLHYIPGGFNAVAQMTNHSHPPSSRNNPMNPPHMGASNGPSAAAVKTRMCNKINSPEGCKFGDKCHFAHNERELGKSSSHEGGPMGHRFQAPQDVAAASFGASATAKISVDASLAGAIIGRGGVNSKHICRMTGAKLSIRDNEADQSTKNIELEGTFDQIKQASAMVRELIVDISSGGGGPPTPGMHPSAGAPAHHHHQRVPSANNFKTKICENFNKGACTFGDRCHFAHGDNELRQSGGVM
ncbi:hypothetical protein ACHQM5_012296 [Ranunculus cassubicifolius]